MNNKKIFKLSDFFLLESEAKILNFRCTKTNLIVWPLLREDFFNLVISKLYYKNEFLSYNVKNNIFKKIYSLINLLKIPIYFKNFFFSIKKKDILYIKTGDANLFLKNKIFDKNIDYLISLNKKNYITLSRSSKHLFFKDYYDKEIYYLSNTETQIELISRFKNGNFKVSEDITNYLIKKIYNIFQIKFNDEEIRRLKQINFIKINSIEKKLKYYNKLIKKIKPKIAIIECASYSQNALLNYTLHNSGIKIAEPQHGLISRGHENYNFSNLIKKSKEYRLFLPNDFLSYGNSWSKNLNVSYKKYNIGNPHRSQNQVFKKKIKKILFISDGINIGMLTDFAKKTLLQLNGKYEVYIRPHPLEKIFVNEKKNVFYDNINIDYEENIYKSLSDAKVIVGEMSTVHYDALNIVPKIFIIRSKKSKFAIPNHPFQEIKNVKDLVKEVNKNENKNIKVNQKDYFENNWKKNFKKYLRENLI